MQTLKISNQKALQLYPSASNEFKAMLEESFGKEFFNQKIIDRVKTFADALNILGEQSENVKILLAYNGIDKDMIAAQAFMKLTLIARALNEGWVPDWKDDRQYKYYPWFESNKSGSGLSYLDYDGWITFTGVGSRLCFKSSEIAEYAGKTFKKLYEQYFLLK